MRSGSTFKTKKIAAQIINPSYAILKVTSRFILFNLSGNVILVTGGAGNYGKCNAESLAEGGATGIIASRNMENINHPAENFKKMGLNVHPMQVDQGNHESVLQLKKNIK